MKKIPLWVIILAVGIWLILVLGICELLYLRKAHSTFDNYYKFRGCKQLVARGDKFGVCKLADGKTIKIILYNGKWYLDGDLPSGFLNW